MLENHAVSRRIASAWVCSFVLVGVFPSISILPESRKPGTKSFKRLIERSKVVFPQPEGPMKA